MEGIDRLLLTGSNGESDNDNEYEVNHWWTNQKQQRQQENSLEEETMTVALFLPSEAATRSVLVRIHSSKSLIECRGEKIVDGQSYTSTCNYIELPKFAGLATTSRPKNVAWPTGVLSSPSVTWLDVRHSDWYSNWHFIPYVVFIHVYASRVYDIPNSKQMCGSDTKFFYRRRIRQRARRPVQQQDSSNGHLEAYHNITFFT